ncbi:LuxR C-terminal-related transcriptional regulator [Streptomyces sp. WMMC940]|uniref:LuxR C-terminal-related transcriptional regulator n=1 Tax=Streptomyces sp. WMMC940 TaxID=3015153 RepID=UPI0022B64E39|nr:LuxR family transcriptional regulator [Streptomyces sp. WMMC940]MCZ7462186.1 LuxR C-terminal-related transcriptional regulator [Streptomyces sp. WMMC940]
MRGREKQLAQTGAQLRRVARGGRSAVLLVEAAPGAGKTRLLAEAATLADADGFVVVGGAPVGSDAAIEAARTRLRHAGGARTAVVLDDLHLASLPALTTLCDLVVALRGLPILWLLAFTTDRGDAPHEPLKGSLGRLRARLPVENVRELGPIEGEALAHLVADCTGAAPDPALLALAESVNDTPRAVIELMRGLADDDLCVVDGTSRLRLGPSGAAQVGGGVPAPVPKRFSVLIQRNLRSLSEPTLKALRLAAVLGSPFAPEDLSALLGEAPVGLLAAVDEAVERGLLVCGEHDLAFRTEPIWRVLLDSVPPPVCALLRRQAAKMLLPRSDGVERAALQLVHVAQPGNAEEIRVISEGARKLLVADPSTAASLATRCMELLAPGQAERVRLARTAVEACTRAGHLERAITLAKAAIDDAAPLAPPLPAELAEDVAALQASMSTALLLLGNVQSARRAAGDALAARRGGGQHREAMIAHLAASYLTGDGTAVDRAQKILDAPDRHTRTVLVGAMTFHAFGQWRDGAVGEAVSTLREAVALDRTGEEAQILDPRWFLAFALTRTDEYEQAAAVIQSSAATTAPETGALSAAVPAVLRAQLHLAQGRLDEAEAEARTGVGTDGSHIPMLAPQAWLVLASVALRRGALTQAEEHVRTLEKDFPQHASSPWWAARLLLNAQLAEAQADPLAAAEVLAEIGAQAGALREAVLEDPAAAAWCVRSMLAADRQDLVEMVIDTTEHLLVRNRRLPSVLATAMHARALAEGDADALARAGRLHRNPWAQAAAAEDHAALLLDRGDHENAISELDRAMSAYGALGGERDAARVRARLRGLGVRRRHWTHAKRPVSGWESLTKTERKVAELVAGGLTNQQAARHLFISPHTVGFHLRQIYRKLGIRSRTALIRLKA